MSYSYSVRDQTLIDHLFTIVDHELFVGEFVFINIAKHQEPLLATQGKHEQHQPISSH